jgi:hypothetical protein
MQALGLLLLSDGSVLLVDNARVDRISRDGILTPPCEVSVGNHGSVAGLVNGDLVIAYPRSVAAYTLPGAPQLAATGWVMRAEDGRWGGRCGPLRSALPDYVSRVPFGVL